MSEIEQTNEIGVPESVVRDAFQEIREAARADYLGFPRGGDRHIDEAVEKLRPWLCGGRSS